MKSIAFHVNLDKAGAEAVRERLASVAAACGLAVCGGDGGWREAEAVVVLGGDGTMLSAVHAFPGKPLLGLNLGGLGYLAGVDAPHFDEAIRALAEDRFVLSRRTALDVAVNGAPARRALNDVVVSRGVSGHAATVDLAVDGKTVTRFTADGIVIATPTGSTAYSLSAGGPILLPDSRDFVVTPICPHALASRPLVIRDTARLSLRARLRDGADLTVFADGAAAGSLGESGTVEVRKSPCSVPLVEISGHDPYDALSRKLGWGGTARAS